MKKIKALVAILLTLAVMFSMSACSDGGGSQKSAEEFKTIGIGTASVGGALYACGGALVNVWNRVGVSASAEVTGGSIQNSSLIQSGEMMSAIISQGTAFAAYKGEGAFKAQDPATNIRAAFTIAPAYMHAWTLDKDAKDYTAFEGKVACGGPAGGTSDEYMKSVLDILGIKPKKFVNASFSDSPNMLRDGLADIFNGSIGAPASAISECASTLGAKIIGVSAEQAPKIIEKMPFFSVQYIKAGTYPNQTEDIHTIGDYNVYCFHKDVPEDVVYNFMKETFNSKEELVKAFAGFEFMDAQGVKNIVLPLHKGAYKFYTEMGIEIPEAAKPID